MSDVQGATAEVIPNFETGKVESKFYHPEQGELVVELDLAPEVAREYAFQLTRASIAIEEHNLLH